MKKILVCIFAIAFVATKMMAISDDEVIYHSLEDYKVYGTACPDASKKYSRLPDSLQGNIRDDLWALGQNSAGLSLRFKSDASNIKVKWHSLNKFSMNHMTATGIRGLDLYVMQPDSTWTFMGSCRPSMQSHDNTSTVMENMEPKMREYMLYLSLYDGVDSICVGVDTFATVCPSELDLPIRHKPVMMYGTSILQGGCATRPGMAHTNILQRMLNREVINLGFSGNARLDPEIAEIMANVDASVYVIDALPNVTIDQLKSYIDQFYSIIRAVRPTTPILFVENPQFPSMRFNQDQKSKIDEKNDYLRQWYNQLDDDNAFYFNSYDVLSGDVECTVDNAHLTDGGFQRFAESLYPILHSLINR